MNTIFRELQNLFSALAMANVGNLGALKKQLDENERRKNGQENQKKCAQLSSSVSKPGSEPGGKPFRVQHSPGSSSPAI